jgi:hypothetical protein
MATIHSAIALNADQVVADCAPINIGPNGVLWLQCLIDNGAGGNPSDSPIGVWELYFADSPTGRFSIVTAAEIVTELAKIAAVGNTAVDAWVKFKGLPRGYAKIRYNQTSGGSGSSRATVVAITG